LHSRNLAEVLSITANILLSLNGLAEGFFFREGKNMGEIYILVFVMKEKIEFEI
jgi:hypothetical protein